MESGTLKDTADHSAVCVDTGFQENTRNTTALNSLMLRAVKNIVREEKARISSLNVDRARIFPGSRKNSLLHIHYCKEVCSNPVEVSLDKKCRSLAFQLHRVIFFHPPYGQTQVTSDTLSYLVSVDPEDWVEVPYQCVHPV